MELNHIKAHGALYNQMFKDKIYQLADTLNNLNINVMYMFL